VRWRLTPLAAALAAALATIVGAPAWAEDPAADGIELRQAPALQPAPRGDAARKLPIILQAQTLSGRPDLDTVAEGNAEFRRGGTVIRADRLTYQAPDDLAIANGNVRISRDGNIYTGPELQLKVQRFEGFFLNPTYHFGRIGAGGSAQRVDFLDEQRAVASRATYTSCPADGSGTPAWLLSTDRVQIDFANNEGIADNAVLRFYGVPILAAPRLSFPLTDARKSGWLPPNFDLDTKSGLQFSIPYYWNIAPNRDATFTPALSTRRGAGLESEFRYLEPGQRGDVRLNLLPFDQLTGTTRYALTGSQQSEFAGDLRAQLRVLRVSDNDYWKDFPRDLASLTPRLLASDLELTRPFGDDWNAYARVQRWQVLQTTDTTTRIEAPYERLPQIGARYLQRVGGGFDVGFEGEFNRFTNPTDAVTVARPIGSRLHALGSLSRPFTTPGWTVTPKLAFNAASYSLDQPLADGRSSASRVIPTLSLDSSWVLERDTRFFGRSVRQTLEPRLLYVNTPFREQAGLPNFDSSAKDFNFDSIFSESAFSGVDRVSDAHQLTAGVTTRVLSPETGAEILRLGIAQRYLFRDQLVTPKVANPGDSATTFDPFSGVGPALTQRFSDLLLLGSTTLVPSWALEASLQYSPDSKRLARSIVSARFSPGPYRTLSATYRLTRGLSEQVELGWQWPIYGPLPSGVGGRGTSATGGASCQGSWYGVGRINYSTLEKRLIDSVVGVEYDAGCWIGRVVASRLSTGRGEATTRLSVQLELVGLSRLNLGSNPLQVLKDNIPGFRLLRDDRAPGPALNAYD
jgi:LPS-assembly protein